MALADICFPNEDLSGDNGHDDNDVLFIGFTTEDAFPQNAHWNAQNTQDFQDSIRDFGEDLVSRLKV